MLTQESLAGELPTPIPNMIHHTLALRLEVFREQSVRENDRNNEYKRMKKEWNRFLSKLNAHKMEKEKLEMIVLEKGITMKAKTPSLSNLEMNGLEKEECLLMKTNHKLVSYGS